MDRPTNLMTTAVFTFAEPFEVARLRRLADERLLGLARFRQRVVKSGLAKTIGGILDLRADPRTPLRGKLGRAKLAVWSEPIALDDVLLSSVAGALRRYLEHLDAPADGITLRAVVPVNLRRPDDIALGNRFGLVFLPLPVGHRGPLDRLHAVKRAMDAIKRPPEAVVIVGLPSSTARPPVRR